MAVSNKMAAVNGGATKPYKREIVWFNALGFLAMHLGFLFGLHVIYQRGTILTWVWGLFIGYSAGVFGVGMGGHRYYTHRTFKANMFIQILMITFHTIAGQNCLYVWVRDHRQHHKYTDTNADPHNATRGFFFSHIGWLMVRKHPEVIAKGKTIDLSDLDADPLVMFQKKYYKSLYFALSFLMPMLVPILAWQESLWLAFWAQFVVRSVLVHNFTWLVNSAAHLYGTRPYNKKIQPVESAVVSFFTCGEGWHNYHHTFPWDYRAGELGQKYDVTTSWIDFFARHGWIYEMKQASPSMVQRWVTTYGDGTHPVYGGEVADTEDCLVDTNDELKPDKNIHIEDMVKDANNNGALFRKISSNNNTVKVR